MFESKRVDRVICVLWDGYHFTFLTIILQQDALERCLADIRYGTMNLKVHICDKCRSKSNVIIYSVKSFLLHITLLKKKIILQFKFSEVRLMELK